MRVAQKIYERQRKDQKISGNPSSINLFLIWIVPSPAAIASVSFIRAFGPVIPRPMITPRRPRSDSEPGKP